MKPHELLTEQLYNEMLSYLKETDEDVPYRDGDYEYFSKTEKGLSYTIHCRRHISPSPCKLHSSMRAYLIRTVISQLVAIVS